MARRGRRIPGLIPWIGRAVVRGVQWCLCHPQPFVALGITVACGVGVWSLVTRSEAFAITEIQVPANTTVHVPESLIGQNLWTIDLNVLATTLKAQQPHLKRLRVIRRLPHTLQIEMLERTPVAQVRLSQWYLVDAEGFILPQGRSTPWDHLVILKGVEGSKPALHVGQGNASERLLSALRVVTQLAHSRALAHRRVIAVDVSNPKHVTVWMNPNPMTGSDRGGSVQNVEMEEGIEIRCGGEEELAIQLERLRAVLQTVEGKPLAIRYIDVRFKDPVIGPRT